VPSERVDLEAGQPDSGRLASATLHRLVFLNRHDESRVFIAAFKGFGRRTNPTACAYALLLGFVTEALAISVSSRASAQMTGGSALYSNSP
jgi:hypothetical protein